MRRFNIVTKKVYNKNGEEKAQWNQVGTLVQFPATQNKDEGFALELNMFPDTKLYVFEQKPKNERSQPTATQPRVQDDGINAEDIPF